MPFDVDSLRARATQLLGRYTAGQKAMIVAALAGIVIAAMVFTRWSSAPDYAALYTDLEPSDAAAVTEELAGQGVSYELADGGRTVMVPRADLYDLRIEMSAAGLPSGGSAGYALLDQQGITTSEFRQRVDYQRAIEGELTKTITAIDGVQAANVHLVIPEDDLFSDDESHPSASVLVKTAPGKTLSPGQVQAVVHLVSSSVEGLDPTEVTIADATGRVLSAPGQEGIDLAAGDARAQQKATFESSLARSVEALLGPIAGPGGAVVQVSAELDFDRRSTTTERFETGEEGAIPLTEATSTETFTGTGTPVGGALAPDGVPIGGTDESTYEREETERTNAVGRVTETVEAAPGSVRRMSVAVLLDERTTEAVDLAEVERLVAAATNLDPERGDELQITTSAFDETAAEKAAEELAAAEASAKRNRMMDTAKTVGTMVVAAVLLLITWRRTRRPRRERMLLPMEALPMPAAHAVDPADADGLPSGEHDALPAPAFAALGEGRREDHPDMQRRIEVQAEIAELVDRQPDDVAQLLRGWLADRRS